MNCVPFLLCLAVLGRATPPALLPFSGNGLFPGFVLTLNHHQLTGQIGEIIDVNGNHSLLFMNDFGTLYTYHPRMIRGFFYRNAKDALFFESKFDGRNWLFLQLLFREKGVSLFQSPDLTTRWISDFDGTLRPVAYPSLEYYLDFQSMGKPIRLTRISYRRKLILLFRGRNPELALRIGKPGYRFQDLPEIIRQFTLSLPEKGTRVI